jgi:hypothetical protein
LLSLASIFICYLKFSNVSGIISLLKAKL